MFWVNLAASEHSARSERAENEYFKENCRQAEQPVGMFKICKSHSQGLGGFCRIWCLFYSLSIAVGEEVLKNTCFLENRSQGHGGCGRKGRDPQGISPCGLEKSNSLNCPRFPYFFLKTTAACAMSWQNPAQASTKLLLFSRTSFPSAFPAKLSFLMPNWGFFCQKISFFWEVQGKSPFCGPNSWCGDLSP